MTDKPQALQKREIMPVSLDAFGVVRPTNLQEALECAKCIAASGMVPKDYINRAGAVLVAMQMGAEVGLTPMAAIQNIAVINGRPSLWGDAMLALIKSDPECEDVEEDDFATIKKNGVARCTVTRRGKKPLTRSFSVEDAKSAGLWGKNTWSAYPWRMLQLRARGFALRDSFPDKLSGIRTYEEERDQMVVEAEFVEAPPAKRTEAVKEAAQNTAGTVKKRRGRPPKNRPPEVQAPPPPEPAPPEEVKQALEETKQAQRPSHAAGYITKGCPACGANCPKKAKGCHSCGVMFEMFEQQTAAQEEPPPPDDDDSPDYGAPDEEF